MVYFFHIRQNQSGSFYCSEFNARKKVRKYETRFSQSAKQQVYDHLTQIICETSQVICTKNMRRWYSTHYLILIFATVIWLNNISPTITLRIENEQQRIEDSLHDFMAKKNSVSMENVSSAGKRIIGKFSICGLSKTRKLNLCKRCLLEEDYIEEKVRTWKCRARKFQYNFPFDDVKKDPKIFMYRCPNLLRRDPKTGLRIPDSRRLYISRMSSGIEQAMVFKREHKGGMITATRHILDITIEDLDNEPPPPTEIRSRGRFPLTPPRSSRNSPIASPTTSSPRFISAQNSPNRFSPTGISPLMSPARASAADQSPSKNILSSISASSFFSPMVSSPPNVRSRKSGRRKTSTTSTPTGSPIGRSGRSATPAIGSGESTPYSTGASSPYITPSVSPPHFSDEVKSSTRRPRRPPTGVFMRESFNPSRLSSASDSGQSIDDSSAATDSSRQAGFRTSRFSGTTKEGENVGTTRSDIPSTSRIAATSASNETKARANIPLGHPKQMYKHPSFNNKNRGYYSETNSPPAEDEEFQGFKTPVPSRTSLADLLGGSSLPGNTIRRTHSDEVSGMHDNVSGPFPAWPRSQQRSAKNLATHSYTSAPPYKSGSTDVISEWREFQDKMNPNRKSKVAGKISATRKEEDKIEKDTSAASSLQKADFLSIYDENVKRHHSDKPTVLSESSPEDEPLEVEDEPSEESAANLTDISASGSYPAMNNAAVQVDLPEKKHASILTDSLGDSNLPIEESQSEEGSSKDLSEEVSEEETTILPQRSSKISDASDTAPIMIIKDESVQAASPDTKEKSKETGSRAKKDQSVQVNLPAKKRKSKSTQSDPFKSQITTADHPTAVSISQQPYESTDSTNLTFPTEKDTVFQVNEPEEKSNINLPPASTDKIKDISEKDAHILFQALSESVGEANPSTSDTGSLETGDAQVVKSAYQTRPSPQGLRSRSGSMTPPRRSFTKEVEEAEQDTIVPSPALAGQADELITSTNISPPLVKQSEYQEPQEPVVVVPVHHEAKISSKSLRRRSPSPVPTRKPIESQDPSTENLENQSTSATENKISSLSQKNEDQPRSEDTNTIIPENVEPLPSEQPGSSQQPPDDGRLKKE